MKDPTAGVRPNNTATSWRSSWNGHDIGASRGGWGPGGIFTAKGLGGWANMSSSKSMCLKSLRDQIVGDSTSSIDSKTPLC